MSWPATCNSDPTQSHLPPVYELWMTMMVVIASLLADSQISLGRRRVPRSADAISQGRQGRLLTGAVDDATLLPSVP